MTEDRNPITGPIPVYVRAIPGGAVLDMEALTRLVVQDVIEALLDTGDESSWDQLHELAELTPETPTPEGRLPYEELVEKLAARSSSRVPLYGRARLLALAERLKSLAGPVAFPGQREAGAA